VGAPVRRGRRRARAPPRHRRARHDRARARRLHRGSGGGAAGRAAADERADVATGLLADIESSSRPGLDRIAIDELDERILTAMTTLDVSDTCIGGTPG
jgi:hypothetical protein